MSGLRSLTQRILPALFATLAGCAPPAPAFFTGAGAAPAVAPPLLGSTPAVLAAEFGPPALRRLEGTSQIWLYHSQVCGLNLILFPDNAGTTRVMDAVPDSGDAASCAASLRRQPVQAGAMESSASS